MISSKRAFFYKSFTFIHFVLFLTCFINYSAFILFKFIILNLYVLLNTKYFLLYKFVYFKGTLRTIDYFNYRGIKLIITFCNENFQI